MAELAIDSGVKIFTYNQALHNKAQELEVTCGKIPMERTVIADSVQNFTAGMLNFGITLGGLWDASPEPDITLWNMQDEAASNARPVLVFPSPTDGHGAYIMNAWATQYQIGGRINEMLPWAGTFVSNEKTGGRGTVCFAKTSTTPESGTSYQLGAPQLGQNVNLGFALASIGSGSVQVILESDDNAGMTSATLRTSTSTGSPSAWWVNFTGNDSFTDDWWRVRIAGTYTDAEIYAAFFLQGP